MAFDQIDRCFSLEGQLQHYRPARSKRPHDRVEAEYPAERQHGQHHRVAGLDEAETGRNGSRLMSNC